MSVVTRKEIAELAKLELHIHLEGCIPLEYVERKAKELNRELPRPLEYLFKTKDLSEFLQTLDWVCALIQTKDDATALARSFGEYCLEQNIVYSEVIINPTHWANIHYSELFPALAAGFDEVERDLGIDIRILPSILRQQSSETSMELARWMLATKLPRILGISIDGNEQAAGSTGKKFAETFAMVRNAGLACTAHAGESSGPEGVISALDELGAHRIDHGVRAFEDPALVQRLIDEQITLNVCIWSNCHHLYDSPQSHPFLALYKQGVSLTLNTDDPIALGLSLNEELAWVSESLALSLDDIKALQVNAVRAAFCSDKKKDLLLKRVLS